MREDVDIFGSSRQPPHHLGQWFAELVPTDALLRTWVALCGPRALRWLYGGILSSRALVGTVHDHIPDTHSLCGNESLEGGWLADTARSIPLDL